MTLPTDLKPPRCAMCRSRMERTATETVGEGVEKQSFKCPTCGFAKTKTIGGPSDAGRHRPRRRRD